MENNKQWFCASCETIQVGNVIQHFKVKHYFNPSEKENSKPVVDNETIQNVVSSTAGFFNDEFSIDAKCPECSSMGEMIIQQNFKSIIVKCLNGDCQKKILYRQVLVAPPVKGEASVTIEE